MRLDPKTASQLGRETAESGFSLIEALAALALSGLTIAMLSMLTSQWMPAWNAGYLRSQRTELLANALERAVDDIANAQFVSFGGRQPWVFFNGAPNAATFLRRALGPSAAPGLEVVRLTEASDDYGGGLLRARAPFSPGLARVSPGGDLDFPESMFALRGAYAFSFSYMGRDYVWRDRWSEPRRLPIAVRITARDRNSGDVLMATSARVHVAAPARCVNEIVVSKCLQ
jgi:general secretion pathway protein J